MKKQWLSIAGLVIIEQLIKLIIWDTGRDKVVQLIPGILRFEPYQNTNLNWLASMAGAQMPVLGMVVLQLAALAVLILFFRYQTYKAPVTNIFLAIGFCAGASGILCSFIDVVFWGGSLDYVGFLNWFIFDLKDVYLQTCWIAIFIWMLVMEKKQVQMKEIPFHQWLREGARIAEK